MDRRSSLAALAVLALSPAVVAFNLKPLDDYRRHHLFILAPEVDAAARALAEKLAAVLNERLAESRARSVPVPEIAQLAAFLASKQFDVAVMPTADAEALANGRPPYVDPGSVPLRVLYAAAGHVLVCRADFLAADAWRIAQALEVLGSAGRVDTALPFHPGVQAFAAGRPQP